MYTAFSTEGINYEITDFDAKLVRRVGYVSHSASFQRNNDLGMLDESIELENTKILYHFLKGYFDEVVFKHDRVHCAGYKMRYSSYGFEIIDMINFGRSVNDNKFNNDMPSPEAVLAFLKQTQYREVEPTPEEMADGETTKIIETLQGAGFKVTRMRQGKKVSEEIIPLKAEKRNVADCVAAFEENKEEYRKKPTPEKLQAFKMLVIKDAEAVCILKFGKLFNQHAKKELNWKQFVTAFHAMAEKLAAPKEDKPKVQPKFIAPLPVLPTRLSVLKEDVVYTTKSGPAIEEPTAVFIAREILAQMPKFYATFAKIASGEVKAEDLPIDQIIKDRTQVFSWEAIAKSEHKTDLLDWMLDMMAHYEKPTMLDRIFADGDIKKGAQLWVFVPQRFKWFFCEVVSEEGGMKVRNENMEVFELFKYMQIEKV